MALSHAPTPLPQHPPSGQSPAARHRWPHFQTFQMPLPTLHRAAVEGDAEAVARLLADSSDAAELAAAATDDELGMTALDFAAFKGHPEVVRLLLAAAPLAPPRPRTSSSLHWAARGGCPATVRLLLGAAAPLATAPDDGGCLPLHWAAQYCHEGVARLLLDAAPQVCE